MITEKPVEWKTGIGVARQESLEDHDCNGERCTVCRRKAEDAHDISRIFGSKRSLTIEELATAVYNSMEEEEVKALKESL